MFFISADPFLPTTLDAWVGFITKAAGLVGLIGGALWKLGISPLRAEVNGLGARVNEQGKAIEHHAEKWAQNDKDRELNAFRRDRDAEIMGQMEATLKKIEEHQERQRDLAVKEDRGVAERLSGLEAEVRGLTSSVNKLTERAFPMNGIRG